MGCACSSEEENNRNIKTNKRNKQKSQERNDLHYSNHRRHSRNEYNEENIDLNANQMNFEPYLQSKIDPYFNFPEVEEDIYVGEGLKRMKGYISTIPKEELLKKRAEFWQTRVEGNKETWEFLQRICEDPEFEHEDIRAYLSATGIVPYKDCINVTYDTFGGLYEIPNYCIHFPTRYDLPETHKEKPLEEQNVAFIIRKGGDKIKIKNTNYLSVKQLKHLVVNNFPKINAQENQIRLFFRGKEMEDDKEIWFYNVENDSIVLMMIRM